MSDKPISNASSDESIFEHLAKSAVRQKQPEPEPKKRRPTNALRPPLLPPVQMPDLWKAFNEPETASD